jgi:hypothetical protein
MLEDANKQLPFGFGDYTFGVWTEFTVPSGKRSEHPR